MAYLQKKLQPKIIEGWVGKAKGSLQILYEGGWIDASRLGDYTIAGKKDAYGQLRVDTSLKYLLKQQSDFAQEEALLQYYGNMMGV
jgi:hypothetical protein